ncbi:nitric oxide reductase activation protein NorD [Mycolicibacterium sp. P9-22]|uniref:nitric oxide reductase activation protein NorD n=1 Tax=Mycolicibacterium sp. P9-22 TaxID=2024613 RepID=UPI0011EF51B8|nr:VWA domain-containing protein [Mycolicibacterium sp. P9-22]KAA0109967.1 VWA domain-containing protein [Mycolicibacterium sp. P9-22]
MTLGHRFALLANHLARRPVGVVEGRSGESAYTDGNFVYVSAGASLKEQRQEVVVQAALLGAGSLDPVIAKALRGRARTARRYLAVEGRRVLHELGPTLPLVADFGLNLSLVTSNTAQSLKIATGRSQVAVPPRSFGTVRPSRILAAAAAGPGTRPNDQDLRLRFRQSAVPPRDEDDEEDEKSTLKTKLFQNTLGTSSSLTSFLSKMLGLSAAAERGSGAGAGGEIMTRSIRSSDQAGPNSRPLPVPLQFASDDTPGPASSLGGALYPEWDVHANRYRPQWCRVITYPPAPVRDTGAGDVGDDDILRRRLARLGLGPSVFRRRSDGDDLDIDALIEFAVDLSSGQSPVENIYLERRKLARNLGVLVLLDVSGSAGETTHAGLSVHEHQRRAAATLAATLEELGDRVGVYGFRSRGRSAVQLLTLKSFGRRFGAEGRAQLNQLEPAGFTRMGAAVRHAGELLKAEAGTPNKLLLVLSDGFPYDDGYEARYAEADTRRALEEVRHDGVACLCLSIGATTESDALTRVFGAASHARAHTLAELSPRIDELFLGALKELSVGQSRR